MKKILLLTDFSDNSLNAIEYATQLFKNEKCTFHIMHVHKIGGYTSSDLMYSNKDSVYDTFTKEPKNKLEALITSIQEKENNKNHIFEAHIDFDVFIDAIKQVIKAQEIDYVVMGTNGISGAREKLLGSNTKNVIKHIDCKTLIIPENYKFKPIKELLLPLDPKTDVKEETFTELLKFIEDYKLQFHILRVNPNEENAEKKHRDHVNLAIIKCKYHIVNNVPIDFALSTYLQTNPIDFMALFVHNEGIIEHVLSKSSTKITFSKITKPMLILHAK